MDLIEFGSYLKKLRKERGLTLSQLAEEAEVSHSYLSQIENGKKKSFPSSEILIKLSKPLNTHYAKLLKAAGYLEGSLMIDGELLVTPEEYEAAQIEMRERWEREGAEEDAQDMTEITNYLKWSDVDSDVILTYNRYELLPEDRQRILDMLKVLFPDRQ